MNAILALGASHLSRIAPGQDYTTYAVVHRGRAIEGLNKALSKINTAFGNSDAMLATCYALTFQAYYMGDGLLDFVTMVRGCALVTEKIKSEGSTTAFNLDREMHLRLMNPQLDQLPILDPVVLDGAITSLVEVQQLMENHVDQCFHKAMLNVIVSLQRSSRCGYFSSMYLYSLFFKMSHKDFGRFVDPNNMVIQLLLAYFIAIQLIMAPMVKTEWFERAENLRDQLHTGLVEWEARIFAKIPAGMQKYLSWPRKIIDTVGAEIAGEKPNTAPVLTVKCRALTKDRPPSDD